MCKLGKSLKRYREDIGITQEQLINLMSKDKMYDKLCEDKLVFLEDINQIEESIIIPEPEELCIICRQLNLSHNVFFDLLRQAAFEQKEISSTQISKKYSVLEWIKYYED